MSILGVDLGGTKLSAGLFSESGKLLSKEIIALDKREGKEVGALITQLIEKVTFSEGSALQSIGISVPGIYYSNKGSVWAPNIPGWDDYPLLREVQQASGSLPVCIDSDRACSILGEQWQGNAKGCKDAIFLCCGTGIGAGILVNGKVLRGSNDIAGAIGWMALSRPYKEKYISCGDLEYYASGEGIVRLAKELIAKDHSYSGTLNTISSEKITAHHVFAAFENNDPMATRILRQCFEYWGMATANLVSIFNPEKIIFGGGVFGPAIRFIPEIHKEAVKWAQPIGITQVSFEQSALRGDAVVYGAGFLALQNMTIHCSSYART